MPIVLILLLVAMFMFGKGKATPGGSGLPEITERRIDYKGRTIFVGPGEAGSPLPFRWRAGDPAGEPIANAFGWAATDAAAVVDAQAYIDRLPPLPPVSPPPPGPGPKEGETVPGLEQCETTFPDGGFGVCLYPQGMTGRYGYRATDGSGMAVATEGGFESKQAARVGAWRMLASMPTSIASSTRHGVRIGTDSRVTLVDLNAFRARAVPAFTAELARGEKDPRGLVLALWSSIWPSVNPLRIKVGNETLADVAARVEAQIPNPGNMAVAVFGTAGDWQET